MQQMTKRTLKQNKALYKYFELVAEALNREGHTVQEVLDNAKIDIFWTKDNFKTNIWHPIQSSMYGTKSTTKLKKQKQIDRIVDVINKFLAENFPDVEPVQFPCQCEECGMLNGNHKEDCSYA